jgi:hypothetical protein
MSVRLIRVSGSPSEIGYQHGRELASSIKECISVYKTIFCAGAAPDAERIAQIFQLADHFKEQVCTHKPCQR